MHLAMLPVYNRRTAMSPIHLYITLVLISMIQFIMLVVVLWIGVMVGYAAGKGQRPRLSNHLPDVGEMVQAVRRAMDPTQGKADDAPQPKDETRRAKL